MISPDSPDATLPLPRLKKGIESMSADINSEGRNLLASRNGAQVARQIAETDLRVSRHDREQIRPAGADASCRAHRQVTGAAFSAAHRCRPRARLFNDCPMFWGGMRGRSNEQRLELVSV